MTNIQNEQLLQWLISRSDTTLQLDGEDNIKFVFFRWKVTDNIDVIYSKDFWGGSSVSRPFTERIEYLGLFYHKDKTMYDPRWNYRYTIVNKLIDADENTAKDLSSELKEKVKQKIWCMLTDPSQQFSVKKLTDPRVIEKYRSFCDSQLEKEAEKWFLQCEKNPLVLRWEHYWTDSSLCQYIENPEICVTNTVENLLEENGEDYYLQFLEWQALEARIEEIKKDPFHASHAAKEIIDTVAELQAKRKKEIKTLTITLIGKDNTEVSVKIDVSRFLSGLTTGINHWDLASYDDREIFDERMSDPARAYYVSDIIRVRYGKQVLYDKTCYKNEILSKIIEDIKSQLIKAKSCIDFGEPQAWIYLSNGRSLEITHEEEGLQLEDQYYSWRVHCSDKEYDNNCFKATNGIIDYVCTYDIEEDTLKKKIAWAFEVANKIKC